MSAVVVVIVLVVIFLALGIGIACTWSFWKRWLNRCCSDGTPPPMAQWEGGPPTFEQLDPSILANRLGGGRNGSSVSIEPLPTLSSLNIDPRESFELRRTRYPQGVVSAENTVYEHDWFHHPHESFPRGNLEYIKVVGKGWFGKVIEAEAKNISPMTKTKNVIVKQMRDDANEEEKKRFLNQCRLYRDNTHPNILRLLGFAVESLPYLVILEHYPLGDLKSYLISKEKAGEGETLVRQGVIGRMGVEIAKALDWLHESRFIHDDLSCRNCLVANVAGKVILGDYGLAPTKFQRDYYRISDMVIPIRWAAPESYQFREGTCTANKITAAANIWSFGVLLMELYEFGKLPYHNMTDEEVISRVLVSKTYLMEPPNFQFSQDKTNNRLYQLMTSCWNTVPENRPTLKSILDVLSSH